ncbi:hypothetical protein K504DRAFT_535988 [Pleomassaria siparia CBS 279.74]|uniref:Uncharacterized protein n=1 Tax=Pleomassaria siparia CBS 279.74 TaxID=1314801 RepID=A0A6G1K0Y9_9PLEO|nr:hypothetical protein K504DRAFT_535988 [Pleomassaria siparia CBS 279.74]
MSSIYIWVEVVARLWASKREFVVHGSVGVVLAVLETAESSRIPCVAPTESPASSDEPSPLYPYIQQRLPLNYFSTIAQFLSSTTSTKLQPTTMDNLYKLHQLPEEHPDPTVWTEINKQHRDLRFQSLNISPDSFCSTYNREFNFSNAD